MISLPSTKQALTPQTLSALLGTRIFAVDFVDQDGIGLSSTTVRVIAHHERQKFDLIVKMLSPQSEHRAAFFREIKFYQHLAPTLSVPLPHCLAAARDDEAGTAVLVFDRSPGAHPRSGLDGAAGERLSDYLARLHVETSGIEQWWQAGWSRADGERMAAVLAQADRPAGWPTDGDRLFEIALSQLPDAYARLGRPLALVHFDLHADNVLVDARGGIVILDWQDAFISHPAIDVGMAAAMLSPGSDRRAWVEKHLKKPGVLRCFPDMGAVISDAVAVNFVFKMVQAAHHQLPSPDIKPDTEWGRATDTARQLLNPLR